MSADLDGDGGDGDNVCLDHAHVDSTGVEKNGPLSDRVPFPDLTGACSHAYGPLSDGDGPYPHVYASLVTALLSVHTRGQWK